jgi:flap endonuclease-1
MGIPWIQAPGEGEAQSSFMARKGDVWAVASQDYDALLFGASFLVRNLSITGRRKLPRKNIYIKNEPEILELEKVLRELNIDLDQLIDIGILIGTDYNPEGIKGIGPKTATKLIKKHKNIFSAIKYIEDADFPHPLNEIRNLFKNPRITKDYILEWRAPNSPGIIDFLCRQHDFSRGRVMKAIEKLEQGYKNSMSTTTLDRWF